MAPIVTAPRKRAAAAAPEAAPKAKKPAQAVAVEDQVLAKIRKEEGITLSQLRPILAAIDHPLSEPLTEACRSMLRHALPLSICVPSSQRHQLQADVVDMVGELIMDVAARLHEAADQEGANTAEVDRKKEELAGKASQAADSLAAASAETAAKEAVLASMAQAHEAAKKVLSGKQIEQQDGDQEMEAKTKEIDVIEATLSSDFAVLVSGAGERDANTLQQHVKAMMSLGGKLSLDDSLLGAMPSSLVKSPESRGPFDHMVSTQVEESFRGRVDELRRSIEALAPAAKNRAEAVEAATEVLQRAAEDQAVAEESLRVAQAAEQEARALKASADDDVAEFAPAYRQATAARDEKRAATEQFDATRALYQTLCDRAATRGKTTDVEVEVGSEELSSAIPAEAGA